MEHKNLNFQVIDDELTEQECPFCFENWGTCAHFELLVGLEAEADANVCANISGQDYQNQ